MDGMHFSVQQWKANDCNRAPPLFRVLCVLPASNATTGTSSMAVVVEFQVAVVVL